VKETVILETYPYSASYFPEMLPILQACIKFYIYIYTGCPRRNGQNFRRVFLMLNYSDITQNTYEYIMNICFVSVTSISCSHICFSKRVAISVNEVFVHMDTYPTMARILNLFIGLILVQIHR